jgi:hypothetical protein
MMSTAREAPGGFAATRTAAHELPPPVSVAPAADRDAETAFASLSWALAAASAAAALLSGISIEMALIQTCTARSLSMARNLPLDVGRYWIARIEACDERIKLGM